MSGFWVILRKLALGIVLIAIALVVQSTNVVGFLADQVGDCDNVERCKN